MSFENAAKMTEGAGVGSAATPRDLLARLFEYIGEQLKDIDPRGFNIAKGHQFCCGPEEVAGLPGLELDIQLDGDHIWLRIERLDADTPPKPGTVYAGLLHVSSDPSGPEPSIDEAAIQRRLSEAIKNQGEHLRTRIETALRAIADEGLAAYTRLWLSWAEGERPRRKTISLYGDLFALKHQIEAEETARPTELVWGVKSLAILTP